MKHSNYLILILCCLTLWVTAQVPGGYYNAANGLTGNNLKAALHTIIDGHTKYPYTSSGTDVWDILKDSDRDPANSNNVILFYTGWSVNGAQEYNSGSGWTREHVWAKSRGNFGTSKGAGTDCHHLRPSDVSVNSARNNRWFNDATDPYYDNGVFTGCYTSSTEWVWEPRDAVKGDVARMLFYMVVRYEGTNGEPDLELVDYIPSNSTADPIHAVLSTLLKWHNDDPVDAFERNRNDVVYGYQGNRNPFIDNPQYVCDIWGGTCSGSGPVGGSMTYMETFNNHNAPSSSYSDGNFVGDNGNTWYYVEARDDYNYNIDGQGLMLRAQSYGSKVFSSIDSGISSLEFDLKKAFTGSGNRSVSVYVNGSHIGTTNGFDDSDVHHFAYTDIDVGGTFTLEFRDATAKQVVIDNIEWTSYDSGKTNLSLSGLREVSFSVYPNPVQGIISFSGLTGGKTFLEVYDLNGALVHHEVMDRAQADLSKLGKGFYILKLNNNGRIFTSKVCKQ